MRVNESLVSSDSGLETQNQEEKQNSFALLLNGE